MSILTLCLSVALLGVPDSDEEDIGLFYEDLQALHGLVGLDLGSIPEKDAANWAVLRISPGKESGGWLAPGYFRGKLILPPGGRSGFVSKGDWERIGALVATPNAKKKGKFDWLDKMAHGGDQNDMTRFLYIFYDGGIALAQHFPDKAGKEQFGTIVMLPEDVAKGVPRAYAFYHKNRDLFGKRLEEEQLVKLLKDEDPMIAVMAAQRLAKSKRLAGKALAAALGGPADSRRGVAIYLALASLNAGKSEGVGAEAPSVPPEIASAIDKADAKMLHWYALGSFLAARVSEKGPVVKLLGLCRQRAKALPRDNELKSELDLMTNLLR